MTAIVGRSGLVKVGTDTVAEVTEFSFEEQGEVVESTELIDSTKTFLPDIASWSGSLTCHGDEADATGQGVLTINAVVALHLLQEGVVAGDIDYNGSAIITGISRSNAGGATASVAFTFQGTGALTRSVLV